MADDERPEETPQEEVAGRQPLSPAKRKRLEACFERANQMMAQENHDYATELFTQCVVGDPSNFVYLQSFLGNLKKKYNNNKKGGNLAFIKGAGARRAVKKCTTQKNWDGVFKAGLDALRLNPWDISTLTTMADACKTLDYEEVELAYLKTAQEANSKDPDVNRLCALALGKRGQFDQAIACWHRVEQVKPGDEEAQRAIASLAVEKTIARGGYEDGDPSKAKRGGQQAEGPGTAMSEQQRLEREIARHPDDIPRYIELAEMYFREERYDKAEEVLARAFEASDGDADVRERWEDAQMRRLRQRVIQTEREAKENDSEEVQSRRKKLRKELNVKELDVHQKRCERYPNNLAFKYDLGVRYQLNERFNEAITEYQQARNDPRRKGLCMLALGQCFEKIKQYRLAMSHYDEAIQEIPDRDAHNKKRSLYLAAWLAYRLGEYEAAERHATTLAGLDFAYKGIATLLDKIAKKREKEE